MTPVIHSSTLEDFFLQLEKLKLLPESQLLELRFDSALFPTREQNPAGLLHHLQQRGWLSVFQASVIASGNSSRLRYGEYLAIDQIGRGGMSRVFSARKANTSHTVAIKVLAERHADNSVIRERFLREARTAQALDHPNIVKVLSIDNEHTPPYLVMEYLEGTSLQAIVALHGTFDAEWVAYCGVQIAMALDHTHRQGLVHRDVKPANVILQPDGMLKLLDLGVVRDTKDPGLTVAINGEMPILGTVDYLAPEQYLDSSSVCAKADIYALGATLYFLLAGHPPFPQGNRHDKLHQKVTSEPPAIHKLRPDVPRKLSSIIMRMLSRESSARSGSPQGIAQALSTLTGSISPEMVAQYATKFSVNTALDPSPIPLPDYSTENCLPNASLLCAATRMAEARANPVPARTSRDKIKASQKVVRVNVPIRAASPSWVPFFVAMLVGFGCAVLLAGALITASSFR